MKRRVRAACAAVHVEMSLVETGTGRCSNGFSIKATGTRRHEEARESMEETQRWQERCSPVQKAEWAFLLLCILRTRRDGAPKGKAHLSRPSATFDNRSRSISASGGCSFRDSQGPKALD